MSTSTAPALRRLHALGAIPASLLQVTRTDPRLLESVQAFLSTPRPYQVVEDVEAQLLATWSDVLSLRETNRNELLGFTWFFSNLGFLRKYKVYGLKLALPFGYSVFDLKEGAGFSFQIHVEPKLEGFHILKAKPGSLLYLATLDEWHSEGQAWAVGGFVHGSQAPLPAGALVPRGGDVVAVDDTETVHTVLGCVLEEYASCSVDSVIRLFDQNERTTVDLPHEHLPVELLLRQGSTGLPLRHLHREAGTWSVSSPEDGGSVITTSQVNGWRTVLGARQTLRFPSNDTVTSVVVVQGVIAASAFSLDFVRGPGEVLVVPPGIEVILTSSDQSATIAIHQVPAEMASYEWSR